ncbi:hypothetical protein P7H06_21755 [Paenibacillus larvae]|nr:hypothetical protein [Paenibacillus larvae]MDT2261591.1 hypothetical protein [Paenibacillus larvae]
MSKSHRSVEMVSRAFSRNAKTISIIAAVAAAIGPLLLILGTYKGDGSHESRSCPTGRSFLGLLGPVGAIIAAIAGVIAIIMNWDSIKEFLLICGIMRIVPVGGVGKQKSACSAAWQSISAGYHQRGVE